MWKGIISGSLRDPILWIVALIFGWDVERPIRQTIQFLLPLTSSSSSVSESEGEEELQFLEESFHDHSDLIAAADKDDALQV